MNKMINLIACDECGDLMPDSGYTECPRCLASQEQEFGEAAAEAMADLFEQSSYLHSCGSGDYQSLELVTDHLQRHRPDYDEAFGMLTGAYMVTAMVPHYLAADAAQRVLEQADPWW